MESSPFGIFQRALRQVKLKPTYELIVLANDQKGENMELHIKWENEIYNIKEYVSHDQHPDEYQDNYQSIVTEHQSDHIKTIKMTNLDKTVVLYTEPINPNQLKLLKVGDKDFIKIKYHPYTSASYPGECMICGENVYAGGFCRVDCPAHHIFHCSCINRWRNTRMTNTYHEHGWQNNCPICRGPLTSMVSIKLPRKTFGFGKSRLSILKKDLKYVLTLN
jgi:hypothetical protein